MSTLRLSDEIHTIILDVSRPIPSQNRDAFVLAVEQALADAGEIGPGSVFRTVRIVQRSFFDPPLGTDPPDEPPRRRSNGKYAR
jgi:hypothetical protein